MGREEADSIWVAKDILTGKYVFITWGAKYDQARYTLIASIYADEVMEFMKSYEG